MSSTEPRRPLAEIIAGRKDKIRELKSRGKEVYPHRSRKTHSAKDITEKLIGESVTAAGRIIQKREMGKASFAHIQDPTGKLQIYLKQDILGPEGYQLFTKDIHVGDILGVDGKVFKTKTGEITVQVHNLVILAKSLRPPPEKWHGLKDAEMRHRFRHLDLMSNREVRELFQKRSGIISATREALNTLGFLEVETPILIPQAGGANARPFITSHKALGRELFLRIATELYLKRLLIGGYERVYEIGRIFRNEGLDTRHNPEFTMLEAYQAYTDYNGMADLMESILAKCARAVDADSISYRDKEIKLSPPFRRARLPELWKEHCGEDIHNILAGKSFNKGAMIPLAKRLGVEAAAPRAAPPAHQASLNTARGPAQQHPRSSAKEGGNATPAAKIFERIFDAAILPHLDQPTFVMDHPTAISPLAKCKPGDESLVERFEFFIGREEIANAFTELNDPEEQRERFAEQMRQRKEGVEEAELLDRDFVEAMEYGMPPAGGIGVGIDRLVMVLTGQTSIRETILFPILREPGGT